MCGIAGFILNNNKTINENDLMLMGHNLKHRGPDNFSYLVRDNSGFAHTRLSIIDVSDAGNQPFYNERYVLCYNGEIYNYLQLKKNLNECDVTFKSASDTEVLFYYLIKKGVRETLKSIQGMFAFSFYDSVKNELYLCRDRLGIKPLNWVHTNNGLYWASEVKALMDIIPVELDPIRTLFSISGNGEMSGHKTIFKDVKQILPGTYLRYRNNERIEQHIYFSPVDLVDKEYYNELNKCSAASITNELAALFDNSVSKMLMSDVPMGIFVSGGIDSSLISLFARKHTKEVNLFTANIVGRYSEFQAAEMLSKSVEEHLYDYKFKPDMLLRDWAKATYYYECPIISFPNAIPLSNVAYMAGKYCVKPVLTGEGSDELFLGYPEALYSRYSKYLRLPVEALKNIYNIIPGLRRMLYPDNSETIEKFAFMLSNGSEMDTIKSEAYDAFSFLPKKNIKYQALTIEMLKNPLIGLLHRNDRMGMMASIESRFPFLDEDMLRLGVNLPYKWKLRKTARLHDIRHPFVVDKYIIRKLSEKQLPKALVNRKKRHFPVREHKNIIVKHGYFQGGYIQNLLGISKQDEAELLTKGDRLFISRLVAIDIFGRLYGMRQKYEDINKQINEYVSLES